MKGGRIKRRDASPILGGDARRNRKRLGDSGVIEENASSVKRVCSESETDQTVGRAFQSQVSEEDFLVKYNMATMLELLLAPGSPNLKGVFEEVVPQQPPPSP